MVAFGGAGTCTAGAGWVWVLGPGLGYPGCVGGHPMRACTDGGDWVVADASAHPVIGVSDRGRDRGQERAVVRQSTHHGDDDGVAVVVWHCAGRPRRLTLTSGRGVPIGAHAGVRGWDRVVVRQLTHHGDVDDDAVAV